MGIENIDSNQADWTKKNIINDYVKIFEIRKWVKGLYGKYSPSIKNEQIFDSRSS